MVKPCYITVKKVHIKEFKINKSNCCEKSK